MEQEDLLYDFINGALEPGSEDELFFGLANNDELRTSFIQMMAVESSIKNNASDIVPPPAVSESVFSSLGYNYITPAATAGTNANKPGMLKVLKNNNNIIMTGIISSLFTCLITYFLFLQPLGTGKPIDGNISEKITANALKELPLVSSFSTSSEVAEIPAENTIIKYKYIAIDGPEKKESIPELSKNNSINEFSNFLALEKENVNIEKYVNNDQNLNEALHISRQLPVYGFHPELELPHNTGLNIEYRYSRDYHFPKPTIQPERYADLNNSTVSLFYSIDSNLSVGLELRQENFYQEFEDNDKLYYQQPNFTSYGIAARYNWITLHDKFKPYTQLSLDKTSVGAVGRIMLGVEYRSASGLTCVLGCEPSALLYGFEGKMFLSPKIGFNLGFGYKL